MNKIRNNILSLLRLEDGWNYGEGRIISQETVLIALTIADELPSHIYRNIEAFPLNDGNISLRVIFQKNLTVGLLINSEHNIHAYIDDGSSIESLGIITLEQIKEFMLNQYISLKKEVNKCPSEDFYTKNTSQKQMEHISQSASFSGQRRRLYPSSILNVHVQVTTQCANTYSREKKDSDGSRYHSDIGSSQNTRYSRKVA